MISKEEMDRKWNAYFIDGTDVLKNKFNITDKDKLKELETNITFKKLVELYKNPIDGNFDKKHLCDIHKFLFEDIYPFAGEYRNVYFTKGNAYFVNEDQIDFRLDETFRDMNNEIKDIRSKEEYAYFLADFYNELVVVHPFREGNGRAIREMLREFVLEKNNVIGMAPVELDWSLVDGEKLLEGIKQAYFSKSLLVVEFRKALVPYNMNKQTDNVTSLHT